MVTQSALSCMRVTSVGFLYLTSWFHPGSAYTMFVIFVMIQVSFSVLDGSNQKLCERTEWCHLTYDLSPFSVFTDTNNSFNYIMCVTGMLKYLKLKMIGWIGDVFLDCSLVCGSNESGSLRVQVGYWTLLPVLV